MCMSLSELFDLISHFLDDYLLADEHICFLIAGGDDNSDNEAAMEHELAGDDSEAAYVLGCYTALFPVLPCTYVAH
eukprot:m.796076 g.796076  ORF g.796076 m.796076 type:complete len:76 (+) comp23341_c0_seq82:99-326(+)